MLPKDYFRLKLKKLGKTIRPFRYDLNQIPYDYTGKVRNRFKGLDLIECLMNYGWRFISLYRRQGAKPSPRKRNAKKAKPKNVQTITQLYSYYMLSNAQNSPSQASAIHEP